MNEKKEGIPAFDEEGREIGKQNLYTRDGNFLSQVTRAVMTFPPNKTTYFDAEGNELDKPDDLMTSHYPHNPL